VVRPAPRPTSGRPSALPHRYAGRAGRDRCGSCVGVAVRDDDGAERPSTKRRSGSRPAARAIAARPGNLPAAASEPSSQPSA
jgi:hypothetical protein